MVDPPEHEPPFDDRPSFAERLRRESVDQAVAAAHPRTAEAFQKLRREYLSVIPPLLIAALAAPGFVAARFGWRAAVGVLLGEIVTGWLIERLCVFGARAGSLKIAAASPASFPGVPVGNPVARGMPHRMPPLAPVPALPEFATVTLPTIRNGANALCDMVAVTPDGRLTRARAVRIGVPRCWERIPPEDRAECLAEIDAAAARIAAEYAMPAGGAPDYP